MMIIDHIILTRFSIIGAIGQGGGSDVPAIFSAAKTSVFSLVGSFIVLALLVTILRAILDVRRGNPDAWKERMDTIGLILVVAIIAIVAYARL